MLTAIYRYGMTHPEVINLPNCALRTVSYVVELDKNGNYVGIRKTGKQQVTCPDMGSAVLGTGGVSNILMEKASIAIGFPTKDEGGKLDRLNGKRTCFLRYFHDGEDAVPEFRVLLNVLENGAVMARIREDAVAHKAKHDSSVGFAIDGQLLSDMPSVLKWWSETQQDDGRPKTTVDVVTGELCAPARIMKQIPGAALGHGNGNATLVCYNAESFKSFKLDQLANAPMSQRTANVIADAFTALATKGTWLGDTLFIHWYEGNAEIPAEDDVLNLLVKEISPLVPQEDNAKKPKKTKTAKTSKDNESDTDYEETSQAEIADKMATDLIKSVFTAELPPDVRSTRYHIMAVQVNMGRIAVTKYETGSYGDLYDSVRAWYDDMELVNAYGTGLAPKKKLRGLLYAMLTPSEKKSKDKFKSVSPITKQLIRSATEDKPVTDTVASRAVTAIRSAIYADGKVQAAPMQMLKIWLMRKETYEGEQRTMPELNRSHGNKAYHCGRLMAVYERVQVTANPKMNAGVLTKFYAACSQNPSMTLGNMQAASVHQMDRIENNVNRALLTETLETVWSDLGDDIPKTLRLEDQAYFALGYWHQRADMNRRFEARWAEIKARKAAATQEQTD